MKSCKRFFGKFYSKDKPKTTSKKNEPRSNGKEGSKTPLNEEVPSTATKQKVAAAKQYIEKHYKEQMKGLQELRKRRDMLEKKLSDAEVSAEEQNSLLKYLEKKETKYMRLQRHKMGADDFEPLTMIGKGAFGEVRICREKSTGHVYAMKKLKKSEMLRRGQVEHVKAERNLLAEVDSNCIVKLYCSFQDEEYLYLIMEYLPGGDMMTLLMRKDTLTEDKARFYVGETVLAIESIHKHNYIHRDIKPDNLLLDRNGHMKLSEFGLGKPLDCSNIREKDFSGNSFSGALQSDGRPAAPKRTQQERLQHWQRNRRMLPYKSIDCKLKWPMAYVESLLQKCTSFSHIQQLQAYLLITGLFHSYQPRSKFLDFCATSGSLPYAAAVFQSIPFPSTNDWNALIRGHAQSHHPINAVTCYLSMSRAPCRPDALTCSFFLKACARALARIESFQMHSHVLKSGVGSDVLLQTTLLDAYAKCGELNHACKLFDEMSKRDIASWNALISGLAQGNRPYEALELFNRMSERIGDDRARMMPNEVTVLGALSACSQLGAIKEGDKVFDYIKKRRLDENVIVCNAVIDMYAKCGMVEKAYALFRGMKCSRSIITWNSMIMGFAMDGNGEKAIELYNHIAEGKEGVEPDSITYLAALCACNHAGMVDEGVKLFELMDKHAVCKNMKHYGSVVDLLGRAGRLDEAYRIIESMPMLPDAVLWQTLLSASKTYGNVEMAEKASRKLVEMGSSDCGDFVLLSNVYAANERWDDVGRVRGAMKTREVKKVPGFSYSEMNGVIYQFYNGDKSHPNWREIYRKLEEITFRIREFGYEPETNYVLHDIGHEEKENALCHHSEKLALAFGLISTEDGSPININKNLRICGDCHVVMKLVSKLYGREIVVRDRTRFHRFKEGSCSCRDFW